MFSKEEKQALIEEFWASLKMKSKQKFGKRYSWILNKTGIKGLQLKFDLNRNSASVLLQCYGIAPEKRTILYDIVAQYHIVMENILEDSPIWDRVGALKEQKGLPSIYFKIEGVDYLQKRYWDEIHSFLIDKMKQMEDAFLEIKDVLKAETKILL